MSFLMVEFRLLPTEQILFMDTKLMLGRKIICQCMDNGHNLMLRYEGEARPEPVYEEEEGAYPGQRPNRFVPDNKYKPYARQKY